MATLNEQYALRNNPHLKARVAAAIAEAADDVRNEAATTPNHADRIIWAIDTLQSATGPENEAARIIWFIVQNTAIADQYVIDPDTGGSTTDGDVQFVVNSFVNFMAGVDTSV